MKGGKDALLRDISEEAVLAFLSKTHCPTCNANLQHWNTPYKLPGKRVLKTDARCPAGHFYLDVLISYHEESNL